MKRTLCTRWPIYGLVLAELRAKGLYTRPTEYRPSATERPIMWDVISDAPMSTEHANARFLVPHLARQGWALFMDGDMLVRGDISKLIARLDSTKAVYCVKHNHQPTSLVKMDGQMQMAYHRKNWSSFIIFNADHPANRSLTPELVNTVPGRDLHRLCWLEPHGGEALIGELDASWNFLVGHSDSEITPDVVHFTDGTPDMRGYENQPYADEWLAELAAWAR